MRGFAPVNMKGDCSCAENPPANFTIDKTKYLEIVAQADYAESQASTGDPIRSAERIAGTVVDAHSGKLAVVINKQESTDDIALGKVKDLVALLEGFSPSALAGTYCKAAQDAINTYDFAVVGSDRVTWDFDDGTTIIHGFVRFDFGMGVFEYSQHAESSDSIGVAYKMIRIGPTFVSYVDTASSTPKTGPAVGDFVNALTGTADLSNPYTSDNLHTDVYGLLDQWNFCDDLRYPWRVDEDVTVGPLMTFNSRGATSPIANFPNEINIGSDDVPVMVPWFDQSLPPRPELAEGAVIGAPNPPGYEPYFDFRHPTWVSDGDTPTGELWHIQCYGQYAPSYLPHATQWVDNYTKQHFPAGPFVNYQVIKNPTRFTTCGRSIIEQGRALVACKWAETIMFTKPTHNFARPCGQDRQTIDPDTVDCNSNPAGSLRWPNKPCFCNDPTQTVGCDSPQHPDADYFWDDQWRKGEFTIDEYQYDFRRFWESYGGRANSYYIHQQNLQNPDLQCTEQPAPAPFNYLEIAAEVAEGDSIGTGSYWLAVMTRKQFCIVHQVCNPGVVYVQPTAPTTPKNGIWKAMPVLSVDEQWGTFWSARVNQWMADPLYKGPGNGFIDILCGNGGELGSCDIVQEDDGSCQHDYNSPDAGIVCIYPMRPWEESLAAPPTSSPPMVENIPIGCPNFIANLNANPPIGNPGNCNEPLHFLLEWFDGSDGCGKGYDVFTFPGAFVKPWAIQIRQEACVASGGRFASLYAANGVIVQ
jgi:hypothetical protein